MIHLRQGRNQFYKPTRRGYILRMLTLDDVTFWGADTFISVIFALFIVTNIEGGSATHVGLALTIRQLMVALFSVPIGKLLDKHKGYVDEVYFLAISGILAGCTYALFGFATELWHVYVLMVFVGISHTLNLDTWRVLFWGSIKKSERGETTGIYQTIMSITGALILALAGFLGDTYGYRFIIWIGSCMTMLAGLIPLFIKRFVPQK
ncbi:MFS transporter [Patescibacteria group bacterium]|nr:MFS transporter [Patescibacteria group bacterium]